MSLTPMPLYYEDVSVNQSWLSPERTISESDVSNFAWLTGDFDPLHMDEEFARQTPFRKPIAHGLLGLSFVAGLSSQSPHMHTAAFVRIVDWRFLLPIYFGDTVHVETEVVEKHLRNRRRGLVVWRRKLINQNNQVVQEGTLETLVSTQMTAAKTARKAGKSASAPAEMLTNGSHPTSHQTNI